MAALVLLRPEALADGVQPFDPGRHMREVAELVSAVFAEELDMQGRNVLRDMARASRLGSVVGGALGLALFGDFLTGYVWQEGGRVVGNVTLQQADTTLRRWRISNVAVAPAFRGRGIARALIVAALRNVARRGGSWVLLQVRADNAAAHRLYESLGFSDVCRDSWWRLAMPPAHPRPADPAVGLQPLRTTTGGELLALARAAREPLAQWAEPIREDDFRLGVGRRLAETLGRWTGLYVVERWGVWRDGRLEGMVHVSAGGVNDHAQLHFMVHPAARGRLETALVSQGLVSLARAGPQPVLATHDANHAAGVAALQTAGFRVQRDLITMRRAIMARDAQ